MFVRRSSATVPSAAVFWVVGIILPLLNGCAAKNIDTELNDDYDTVNILSALIFLTIALTMGACICCRRSKQGFKLNNGDAAQTFSNESTFFPTNGSQYPIFRTLAESPRQFPDSNRLEDTEYPPNAIFIHAQNNNDAITTVLDLDGNINNNNSPDCIRTAEVVCNEKEDSCDSETDSNSSDETNEEVSSNAFKEYAETDLLNVNEALEALDSAIADEILLSSDVDDDNTQIYLPSELENDSQVNHEACTKNLQENGEMYYFSDDLPSIKLEATILVDKIIDECQKRLSEFDENKACAKNNLRKSHMVDNVSLKSSENSFNRNDDCSEQSRSTVDSETFYKNTKSTENHLPYNTEEQPEETNVTEISTLCTQNIEKEKLKANNETLAANENEENYLLDERAATQIGIAEGFYYSEDSSDVSRKMKTRNAFKYEEQDLTDWNPFLVALDTPYNTPYDQGYEDETENMLESHQNCGYLLEDSTDIEYECSATADDNFESMLSVLRKQLSEVLPQYSRPSSANTLKHEIETEEKTKTTEEEPDFEIFTNDLTAQEIVINYKRPLSPIVEESENETYKNFLVTGQKCVESTSTSCIATGEAFLGVNKILMTSNDTLFNLEDALEETECGNASPSVPGLVKQTLKSPVDFTKTVTQSLSSAAISENQGDIKTFVQSSTVENFSDHWKGNSDGSSGTGNLSDSSDSIAFNSVLSTNLDNKKQWNSVLLIDNDRISETSEPTWNSSCSSDLEAQNLPIETELNDPIRKNFPLQSIYWEENINSSLTHNVNSHEPEILQCFPKCTALSLENELCNGDTSLKNDHSIESNHQMKIRKENITTNMYTKTDLA